MRWACSISSTWIMREFTDWTSCWRFWDSLSGSDSFSAWRCPRHLGPCSRFCMWWCKIWSSSSPYGLWSSSCFHALVSWLLENLNNSAIWTRLFNTWYLRDSENLIMKCLNWSKRMELGMRLFTSLECGSMLYFWWSIWFWCSTLSSPSWAPPSEISKRYKWVCTWAHWSTCSPSWSGTTSSDPLFWWIPCCNCSTSLLYRSIW